jgi:sulfatase maturation enzyme AslB (radical SAM superfamily)
MDTFELNKKEKPWIVNLELTNACNLECVFCDHPVLKKEMEIQEIDDSLLRKILSDIKEYEGENKVYELGLVGLGEPTLDRYFERHIELINSYAYMFERLSLNSNLVSLSQKSAEILLSSKINVYTFSVNVSSRETYVEMMGRDKFRQVIENLKYFLFMKKEENNEARVDVQVFDSDKNNLEELRSMLPSSIAAEINFFVRKVYSKPVIMHSTGLLRLHTSGSLKRYPCWDIYTRAYIDVEGNLYPCTIGNDSYREKSHLCLGNVYHDSLFHLFNNRKILEARYKSEKNELPFPECTLCNIWSLTPNNFDWDDINQIWRKKSKQVRAYGLKG